MKYKYVIETEIEVDPEDLSYVQEILQKNQEYGRAEVIHVVPMLEARPHDHSRQYHLRDTKPPMPVPPLDLGVDRTPGLPPGVDPLLNATQAGEVLDLSPGTVIKDAEEGIIPFEPLGETQKGFRLSELIRVGASQAAYFRAQRQRGMGKRKNGGRQ